MAVEAVASAVIQKITDLMIQDALIFYKVTDQVEDVRLQLRQLRGFLKDAEEIQRRDESFGKWVKEYLEIIYCVEDMVESHVLSLARKKGSMGFLQKYGFFFHGCKSLRKNMKCVVKKIQELNETKPPEGTKNPSQSQSPRPPSRGAVESQLEPDHHDVGEEDSDFIGFKEHMDRLVHQLLSNNNSRIIQVVGSLGSGKTTLVERAYHQKSTREKFECRVWLNVSEDQIAKDLMLKILNLVNKKHKDGQITVHDVLNEAQLGQKLSEQLLQDDKYLIVLDYGSHFNLAWEQLVKALPERENGSKVVLITREEFFINDNVSLKRYQTQYLRLEPLGDIKSWKLFQRKLCLDTTVPNFQQQILKKCQGLPLNIVLLGGLLATKKVSQEEWARLFNHPNWGSSEIWLLSYNDLPPHYNLCLLYLGLFPKEYEIPVRRILRLWVAEGFLSEDFAEKCLNYLVKRSLVKVTKFRSDGGPKVCLLPVYLRQHLSPKAQEIRLFHIHHMNPDFPEPEPLQGVRRIVEYTDIKGFAPGSDSNSIHVKNLRSYLSFNFPRHDVPAKQVGNFLSKIIGKKGFGLLRVLDLEGVYKPTLPETLKHLLQLRYLGLRWTFLDTLPDSVGDLPYLETLDLKRTYINKLPSAVWKLQHLKHLNLPEVWLDMCMLQPRSQLLTLWGIIINGDHNQNNQNLCGLDCLVELRELGITCCNLSDFDKIMDWIKSLARLQSLSLTSIDKMHRPSNISLPLLSKLGNLHHLKLMGKLTQMLEKQLFPPNLKVLTLSVSHLTQDPMQTLSQLPHLAVLRLLAKSYIGQKMQCPQTGFQRLSTIKLWMLDELEEWTVHQEGMPRIKKLNIRHCHKLQKIPLELLTRPTLEELVLDDMPPEFVQYTDGNKSKSTLLTVNSYKFSPLPWEKNDDLWNESSLQRPQESSLVEECEDGCPRS